MNKNRKSSDAHIRASLKYNKEHVFRKHLSLNKTTDADIIDFIASLPNFQGYVKELIRNDMKTK